MDPDNEGLPSVIKELHRELAFKYQKHGPAIERSWRAFDKSQRARVFKAGAAEGVVLKHRADRSLGNVYLIIPELNLREVAGNDASYLLDLLQHRATRSLLEQYREGPHGGPGDAAVIMHSIQVGGLQHANSFKHSHTQFLSEKTFGESFTVTDAARYDEVMAGLSVAVKAGALVPQATGELILQRLLCTLQALNSLVEDILDADSTAESHSKPHISKNNKQTASSKARTVPVTEKLLLPDMVTIAFDMQTAAETHLLLCRSDPGYLAHVVNIWFFTRPELIQDNMGRVMPRVTDKYISIAFFEAIHNALVAVANWDYLSHLLQMSSSNLEDKVYHAAINQELSNVCYSEYERCRRLLKRQVQRQSGSKKFQRIPNATDGAGSARVSLRADLDATRGEDPQLHHLLQLCQPDIDSAKAMLWIRELDNLHQSHPSERERMNPEEIESFSALAEIISFTDSLSKSLRLPENSRTKGQQYIAKSRDLANELYNLKPQVDLADFVVPMGDLKRPENAAGALAKLDVFMVENKGDGMGPLYRALVEDCISALEEQVQEAKNKIEVQSRAGPSSIPHATVDVPHPKLRPDEPKIRDKSRGEPSSKYAITSIPTKSKTEEVDEVPAIQVKSDTAHVFDTLFSKSESRGSIRWDSFEAAMVDVGFTVEPSFGSVFSFRPSSRLGTERIIAIHRPHGAKIERHFSLSLARRLQRVYGWNSESFVAT